MKFFPLVAFIMLAQAAGLVGALFTADAIPTWYATLVRPEFAPPNWIFGPVWTTLYVLMGVAAYLIWDERASRRGRMAYALFGAQLVLNTLWSVIFFGQYNIGGALIEIIVLWLAIVATIIAFARISRLAAWLLVPYVLWVSFATYLNYSFWLLN